MISFTFTINKKQGYVLIGLLCVAVLLAGLILFGSHHSTYEECLIEKMKGQPANSQLFAMRVCSDIYPGSH